MKSTVSTSSKVTKDPWAYFQPGQMIFAVKHKENALNSDQIQSLFVWSNQIARDFGLYVIPERDAVGSDGQKEPNAEEDKELKDQKTYDDKLSEKLKNFKIQKNHRPGVYSFSPKPQTTERFRAQIQPKAGIEYKSPQIPEPAAPFTLIRVNVIDPAAQEGFVERSTLAKLVMTLEKNLQDPADSSVKPALDAGASLEAVTFNWLMGAAQSQVELAVRVPARCLSTMNLADLPH